MYEIVYIHIYDFVRHKTIYIWYLTVMIWLPLFAYADTGIHPLAHSAAIPHGPKTKYGIVVLGVDKFPYSCIQAGYSGARYE